MAWLLSFATDTQFSLALARAPFLASVFSGLISDLFRSNLTAALVSFRSVAGWLALIACAVGYIAISGIRVYLQTRRIKNDVTERGLEGLFQESQRDKLKTLASENRTAAVSAITRADTNLGKWGGARLWSLEGFERCWWIALLYPIMILLLVWAATGDGRIGSAQVLPDQPLALNRWLQVIYLALWIGFVYSLAKENINDFARTRSFLGRLGRFGTHIGRFPDSALAMILYVAAGLVYIAGAGAGAGAGAVAVAVAGAGAVAVAVAGAVAGAVAAAVALAGAGAVAFAVADTVAGTVAGTVAVAFAVAVITGYDAWRVRSRKTAGAVARVFLVFTFYLMALAWLIPALPSFGVALRKDALSISNTSFTLLFFVGLMPLLNAISDWASVNFTRCVLQQNRSAASSGQHVSLVWLFLDVAVAVALCFVVYAGALLALRQMAIFGWTGIDIRKILDGLSSNPWSGQSNWLLLLALTNLLPTAYHLALWFAEKITRVDPNSWAELQEFLEGKSDARDQVIPIIQSELFLRRHFERGILIFICLGILAIATWCVPWLAGVARDSGLFNH
jgi:hypothetical protein